MEFGLTRTSCYDETGASIKCQKCSAKNDPHTLCSASKDRERKDRKRREIRPTYLRTTRRRKLQHQVDVSHHCVVYWHRPPCLLAEQVLQWDAPPCLHIRSDLAISTESVRGL